MGGAVKERKSGREEEWRRVCRGTGLVPWVSLRQRGGMRGIEDDVGGGMGESSAGGTEVVRSSAYPLHR